jgi:PTH1 family peptidyl-tRNA hydrolase
MLLVGLGNPGDKYQNNRHNVGFILLDAIHEKLKFDDYRSKFKAHYAVGEFAGKKIHLLKPQTFMNDSGVSVQEAAAFFKIPLEDVIVIYDELDLNFGKIRIKKGGGNGGHNGIRSIDAHLGSDYQRLRFGIGHPGVKELVTSHVLGNFSKDEKAALEKFSTAVAKNVDLLISKTFDKFMSKYSMEVGELV